MFHRRWLSLVAAGLMLTGELVVASPAGAAPVTEARQGPVARAAAPGNPVDYAYDGAGQLRGVSTSADGAAARYAYDDSGNLTSIERSAAGALTVAAISPSRAAIGTSVTISGTGFAATAGGNTVRFNGTAATVTSASATRLVATVPAGTTTGAITVGVGTATATSKQSFTVTAASPAPAVSGFSPGQGAAGTIVTISGSGFSATPAENNVSFGRTRARVTAATTSSLTVMVPGAAVSGKISVATPGGLATSSADFVAVTTPFGAGDIGSSAALAVGGSATSVSFGTAGKAAVLRFTGVKGQRLSLGLTGSTVGDLRIYGYAPQGGSIGRDEYDAPWLLSKLGGGWATPPLPTSGNYQVVVKPVSDTATGSVTATLSANVTGAFALNGGNTTVNLTRAGQQAEFTVDAAANQRINLGVSNIALSSPGMTVEVRDPDGVPVVFPKPGSYGFWRYSLDLPDSDVDFTSHKAGRYTVLFRTRDQATGSFAVTASTPHDAGTTSVGATRTVSVTRPGQDSRITFNGVAGQTLGLEITDYPMTFYPRVELIAPDGSTLALFAALSSWSDLPALPATGTYTLYLSTNSGVGDYHLALWEPQAAGSVNLTGAGTSVSFTAGRAVTLTVPVTSGNEFTLAFSNWTLPSGGRIAASVVNPAGVVVHDEYVYSLSGITVPAATTGNYRVVLRPSAGAAGSVLVTGSTTQAGGTLAIGAAKTVTSPRLSQPTRTTFTGVAGQRLSLHVSDYAYQFVVWAKVTRPDGTKIYDGWLDDRWLAMEPLATTGTYTLDIQPRAATGGSLTFALVQAIDGGTTIVGGATKTITTTAGRYVDTTLSVTANQRLSFGFTAWSFAATSIHVRLVGPTGAVVIGENLPRNMSVDTYQLPAGTYRLSVIPTDRGAGSVTVTASAQISGGAWSLNAAKTVSTTRAGQATWYTYAGTAGQNLALGFTNVTMPYSPYVWVRRPNGAELAWLNGAATVAIPSLPTTGTYEILISPYSSTGSATATLRTRTAAAAKSAPAEGKATAPQKAAEAEVPTRSEVSRHTIPTARKLPDAEPMATATATGDGTAWQPNRANLDGEGWSTGRGAPQKAAEPLQAGPGITALSGRVRTLDDKPLAGVTVSVDNVRGKTDAQGRFLLTGLRNGRRVLRVDGASASTPQRTFGLHDIGVDLTERQTTTLPFTVWLAKLDTQHTVKFPSPTKGEVTIGTPAIPGLEVKLPAGAVVRDVNGKVVTELGITAIPTDRAPFPLPRSQVPSYFTVQPGSSYIFPAGAKVIYPNFTKAAPGAQMDFWHYDPAGKGWFVYGKGTVTPDGKRVVPNKGTEVYQFTGAMLITPGADPPPKDAPKPGEDETDADPVDLGSGLFLDHATDLALDDVMPIELTRTYQQSDTGKRGFGIGTTLNYNLDLYSENRFYDCWLILPDGGRIKFNRVSPGGEPPNGYINGTFAAEPSRSAFGGSILAWNGDGWDLRLRDGTTYIFGDEAPLQGIRDKFGNTITITRAPSPAWTDGIVRAKGPITQITSPNGKWIKLSYDSSDRVKSAEDVLGRTVKYEYNAEGRLETVTDVDNKQTIYTYEAGRMKTIRDGRNTVFLTNEYDANGRVSRQIMPGNLIWRLAYTTDAAGKVTATEVTNPRGVIRRVTFDAQSRMVTDTAAHGTALAQTLRIERDEASGLPSAYVDSLGRRTEMTYDAIGNTRTVTELADTPEARTSTVERNGPFDQITKVVDPLQHGTELTYRPDGSVHTAKDPNGRTTVYETNEAGQVVTATDAANKVTRFGYHLGEQVSVTDPLGNVHRTFSDAAGRSLRSTDATGNVTAAAYDPRGRITGRTDALGNPTTFEYDANGNLHKVTDAREHTRVYDWDLLDRLSKVTDPLNRETIYTYDDNGNLATVKTPAGKLNIYEYDELDRLRSARFGASGNTQESTATYTYDAGDRLRTITDSAAGTTTITPDVFDRPASVAVPNGQVSYTYDAADRRRTMTVPGLPVTEYDYNDSNQLTSVKRGGQTASIGYDTAGRRDLLTLPTGVSQTYGYDDASRLTGITYRRGGNAIGGIAYTLDALGRPTHVDGDFARTALPAATGPFTYDAADQRVGDTYDNDGNLVSDGSATYTWDARGQLASYTKAGQTVSYRYDGLGRRAARTAAGVTRSYVYDDQNVVQEKVGDAVAASVLTGSLDEVFARTVGDATQSPLTDALGSSIATADGSALTAEYTYDPFGVTTVSGNDLGNPSRFTGREDDGDGLYHLRNRFYSPGRQSFLSQDPLGLAAGAANPYHYVGNQPTAFTDPMGLKPRKPPTGGDTANCTPDGEGEYWVDPNDVNFSQRTVSPNDYVEIMKAGQWNWDQSPLTVISRNGQLVSYDNRRLDAARQVRAEQPDYKVKVREVNPRDPNPAKTSGKNWDQSFEERMTSKRNRDENGCRVPWEGREERPEIEQKQNKPRRRR